MTLALPKGTMHSSLLLVGFIYLIKKKVCSYLSLWVGVCIHCFFFLAEVRKLPSKARQ